MAKKIIFVAEKLHHLALEVIANGDGKGCFCKEGLELEFIGLQADNAYKSLVLDIRKELVFGRAKLSDIVVTDELLEDIIGGYY